MELKLTPRFLQNGQRFFGPGVAELLERVAEAPVPAGRCRLHGDGLFQGMAHHT